MRRPHGAEAPASHGGNRADAEAVIATLSVLIEANVFSWRWHTGHVSRLACKRHRLVKKDCLMITTTYHLIDSEGSLLASGDTIEYLQAIVGDLKPGRYTVDEVTDDTQNGVHNKSRWGAIRKVDGDMILLEPEPWDE